VDGTGRWHKGCMVDVGCYKPNSLTSNYDNKMNENVKSSTNASSAAAAPAPAQPSTSTQTAPATAACPNCPPVGKSSKKRGSRNH